MKNILFRVAVNCLLSVLASGLLAACAVPPEAKVLSRIEVTDQLGRVVKLDKVPARIVSLAPSNTEILFALDLGDEVVGITDYDDYPPEAKEKPSIGGFSTPDIERVVALSPDLVLATSIHQKRVIPQLEEKGLTVLALAPKTIDEVMASIKLIGQVTGKQKEATDLVAEMQKRIKAVTDKTDSLPPERRPGVFYLLWHDPLMTSGPGTLQNELIVKAGGTNIAGGLDAYATIGLEAVIQANPEVIIAGVGMGSGEYQPLQFVLTEERLRGVDARISQRLYGVDNDLTGRAGPRIVDALEAFARVIHPELFQER